MGRYLASRFAISLISVWILGSVCFLLLRTLPGRPFLNEESVAHEVRESWERELKLDQPLLVQYVDYWTHVFSGELGRSYQDFSVTVESRLARAWPTTFMIASFAFIVAIAGGLSLALLSQIFNRQPRFWTVLFSFGFNLPTLLFALFLIEVFAVGFSWFPVARMEGPSSWVLPVLAVACRPIFKLAQILNRELNEFLVSNVGRSFFALGFSKRQILTKWSLRMALLPFLAYSGTLLGHLIGGSVLVEVLFVIPGMGDLFREALSARDYPVILGQTLLLGSLIFFVQFICDALICWLDPRVRETLQVSEGS